MLKQREKLEYIFCDFNTAILLFVTRNVDLKESKSTTLHLFQTAYQTIGRQV